MLYFNSLVFATNNTHKLDEALSILGKKFQIISLKELGCHVDIPETASTLQGNALMKARFIYNNFHVNCFADDTGLEVTALNQDPGVNSARYAGNHDSEANMNKLLIKLRGKKNRNAQFRTVIALIIDGKEHLFEGVVNGSIGEIKRGKGGFGYDPLFIPNGFVQTFSEMEPKQKNAMSHRAIALKKLFDFLNLKYELPP
ncbi:MAG TPA: non-canonical purine NTP diphosphatase [Bacteroidaceae bacterium]|nr:non-canonical purine NTP diphosphatase [Bacteroidaceae bacterium]